LPGPKVKSEKRNSDQQADFGKLPCLQPKIKLAVFKQQIWTKLGGAFIVIQGPHKGRAAYQRIIQNSACQ